MAHELNQPLAAIRNYSEGGLLRLAKNRPHEDIVPVLEKIQLQVERADAIVRRLRTLIKKRCVAITTFNLEQLISDTLELMHFRLQKQTIEVVRSTEGRSRPIEADIVGLQQALVNVISNSIDACVTYAKQHPDLYSGKIAIHTDFQKNIVSIRIIDNGTGLKQDNPTEAFVSSKVEGLGLGLSICRDVLEMHGGEFVIQSTKPHGCMVGLTLPYQAVKSLNKSAAAQNEIAEEYR